MPEFRRVRRRVVAALVGVAVIVSLSGCWVLDLPDLVPTPGPTPSGHADQLSREQAAAMIEQVPGVHALSVGGGTSGFSHYTEVEVRVDDVALAESPEVLEFLFAVGWAMSEFNSPPGVIHLTVWPPKGTGTLLELQPQVNAIFGTTLDPQDGYLSAILQAGVMEERWGPWPGAIPEVPVLAFSPTPGPTPSGHADQLSREQAAALIEQVPGIHALSVGSVVSISTHGHDTSIEVRVDDAVVMEQPEVLEFLFAVGWAMSGVEHPPSIVQLTVWAPKGAGVMLELQPQTNAIFGTTIATNEGLASALVGSGTLEARWGPWPGAIPEIPVVASPVPG